MQFAVQLNGKQSNRTNHQNVTNNELAFDFFTLLEI